MEKVSQRITRLDPGGEQETVAQDAFLLDFTAFFAFYLYRLSHVQLARDRVSLCSYFWTQSWRRQRRLLYFSTSAIAKVRQSEITDGGPGGLILLLQFTETN